MMMDELPLTTAETKVACEGQQKRENIRQKFDVIKAL